MDRSQAFVVMFSLFVVAISAYIGVEGFTSEVTFETSNHDQNKYLVRNLPDRQEAADMLSKIREKLVLFVSQMKEKYPRDSRVKRLCRNFNPDQISESAPDSKYTSYSINKGEKIVFCIRQRNESNELVDLNTMIFVAIHELAHVMTLSKGHTKEFWDNMKFLLEHAVGNIYTYQPFHEDPKPYCGTMITDTPYKIKKD